MSTTFTHKGQQYTVDDDAVLSNRVFNGWWGDANEGDEYTAEYKANAVDSRGIDCDVYFQFDAVKGQEPEDESEYPFDDDHISKVVITG